MRWDAVLGGFKNTFIFGAELSDNHVVKGNYANVNLGAFNCRTNANASANNAFCVLDANGTRLAEGDGLAVEAPGTLTLTAEGGAEFLLFDLG